jgi:predicted TIM-barrel fold metal-dependent hydrolase
MAIPHRYDPEGKRLPVKLDTTTNGEFAPLPLARVHHQANHLANEMANSNARRRALSRRDFLVSTCGAATTLLAMNAAYAEAGKTAAFYALAADTGVDEELAQASLEGDEFIFDVQGHFVEPSGAWLEQVPKGVRPLSFAPKTSCLMAQDPGERSYLQCLGPNEFIKDVFKDSDTDMIVLSFVPSRRDAEPLTIEEAAATAQIVEKLDGSHRMLLHGRVNPNQEGDLEGMDQLAENYPIAAWKTYTQWGPEGRGFFLDDEIGIAFIEKARKLGVTNIAIHKGLPFGRRSYEHSLCDDIGRVAKRYPDVNFLVYHSGFVAGQPEGPYDPDRNEGVDSLVRTVLENEVANANVYAELGSTWRFLMRDPDSAAHALGKLFKHVGENNVLWGTDSIWYGSPQDQIQAFRSFQIAEAVRETHGYPEITPALRAKVFGHNALKVYGAGLGEARLRASNDRVARERAAYREHPDPSFRTYGPKTRREFFNLLTWSGGRHA